MNKEKTLVELGNKIRRIRLDKEISQELLAEKSGLDRTYIGGIERGERNLSVLSLEKITKALNLTLVEFFTLKEDEDC